MLGLIKLVLCHRLTVCSVVQASAARPARSNLRMRAAALRNISAPDPEFTAERIEPFVIARVGQFPSNRRTVLDFACPGYSAGAGSRYGFALTIRLIGIALPLSNVHCAINAPFPRTNALKGIKARSRDISTRRCLEPSICRSSGLRDYTYPLAFSTKSVEGAGASSHSTLLS